MSISELNRERERLRESNGASVAERAAAEPDAQDGLFDQVVEDPNLVLALDQREQKRQKRAKVQKEYDQADAWAKGLIAGLELEADSVVRCGRFRIKVSRVAPRSVSFTTQETTRTTISLLADQS